jgi:N-terminal domain of galactosyltransferase
MTRTYGLRQRLGALLLDMPRYIWNMCRVQFPRTHPTWVHIRNRNEGLIASRQGIGVKCDWQWTSELHLANVFPVFGKWLCRRTLRDFPIVLSESPHDNCIREKADVCFAIGHRGRDRLPLLLRTLESIAGQKSCAVECIVVEQDNEQRIRDHLPKWVSYLHTPPPKSDMPFSRAWAFNVAARAARSECLIFHDGDMLVCRDYAKFVLEYHQRGFAFINLKRFIFYLSMVHSKRLLKSGQLHFGSAPEAVVQNLEAGGGFGADKSAFWEIGGFDERFVGWGGEDNELWERAQTQQVYSFGFLPVIHLWHAPQQERYMESESSAKELFRRLTKEPVSERIRKLKRTRAGELDGPKVDSP